MYDKTCTAKMLRSLLTLDKEPTTVQSLSITQGQSMNHELYWGFTLVVL